jgi:hypothetical protein
MPRPHSPCIYHNIVVIAGQGVDAVDTIDPVGDSAVGCVGVAGLEGGWLGLACSVITIMLAIL